jgi:hypothetical protein
MRLLRERARKWRNAFTRSCFSFRSVKRHIRRGGSILTYCAIATVQSRIRHKKPIKVNVKCNRTANIVVCNSNVGKEALQNCRGEWAVRLFHAPPHGKHASLL